MTNAANTAEITSARVWFITGASSGIGRELAGQALAAGESVVAVARDAAKLDDLGPAERLLTISADVRDETAVQQAVEQAVTRFGRIDVLANNAGYGVFGAVEEATDAQARALFDTNVFGVLNVLRAALPVLRAQRSGHILQGSSIFGQTAAPGFGMLAASKYAVEGLSDALALEVAPLGIKVTLVQPGPTATAFGANVDPAQGAHTDYDATVRAPQGDTPASAAGKVAEGIRAAVADPNPPRRLALGVLSAGAMRDALTARLADLDAWAGVSEKVDA
ncbi:SDR family NAD(P)-dependent oxidoreductase [Amycolatopsis sp. NPDC004169]|uniref:SDR family NAD(P)-dependent oxidoreductase n=1 Tax=Amycolatopsis sp. NPDC004169 TaxID=3154453 RepID=UPI0033A82FD7